MLVVIYLALSFLVGSGVSLSIGAVGKERRPITPGVAVVPTAIAVLQFIGITYLYQH